MENIDTTMQAIARPRRSWAKRITRALLWTVLILFLLMLLILGAVYWLAGTDSGFARVSSLANEHVAGLSIDAPTGNLRDGISAESVSFTNESIDIKATSLSSGWQLGCLTRKRFCLDDLHIEALDIATKTEEAVEPAEPRTGAIELPDIALPIDISISDITIGTVRFQAPGDAPLQIINDIQLSASTDASKVTIANVSLAYQQFTTGLAGTVDLHDEYPVNLILDVNADDVLPDTVPEGNGAQALQVDVQLSGSLANLVIDTTISGVADVTLNATVQPLELNLPATLSIASDSLGWPITSKTQVLASGTRIKVSGDMDDYAFSLNTNITGEQVPETGIRISGVANTERVTLPDIDIKTLGGSAEGTALVSLAEPMVWTTGWRMNNIDPSLQVPDLKGSLNGNIQANGTVSSGKWSLNLDSATIDGVLRELPFKLDAKLAKGLNDLWVIQHVSLNNDRNQLKAQGIVGDTLDIKADINLPQLQNFMPGLAGGFDVKLLVDGAVRAPHVVVDATADVLRFNDILVQSLAINGDIEELFIQDSSLEIDVDTVRIGTNTISNTALTLQGKRTDHQLTLKADGPQQTTIDLALSGDLDDAMNWTSLLEKVQAALPGHALNLEEPAAIAWQNADQRVSVSPHCWRINEASNLCLQDEFNTDANGETNITLDSYALEQLNAFLPEDTRVGGDFAANVALRWGENGPDDKSARVAATIDDATVSTVDGFGDPVEFGYDTIALDADVAPDDVSADLTLSSQRLGDAAITVQLDPSNPDSAIDGSIALDGLQVEIAKAFLPDFDEVSGTLSAEGQIGGTLTAPEYNGNIILASPILQAEILPLPITGGNIIARINGQSMTLDGQILSNEGRIVVGGRGSLDPQNWSANVTLKGEQLNVQSDPLQSSIVNHDVRIEANARRVSVTGDIDIPLAVIDVAELPQGAATVSSDVVIIEDIEEEAVPVDVNSNLNTNVALDVSLGDEVSLSAYGLTANLTGDMDVRIRGARPPQLGGEIRVVDGIFKKYGQDLQANGQIIFVGPVEGTRLAIDAVREIEIEERTAGLRIQGTVATPEITLFTDPSDKSQDAILSYIILGRDINEASDQEADLLQTAALALAVKGGSSIGGGVANALGVKEFGLETRGSGDNTELIVSGRINDRLLLRYGRGVFDAQNTLYLRYDLTKKLYLEAATSAVQNAADLFYSFSF
ncbi:MAG: translocation/assembly module TamB domain-containing protein [Granulosicoccus sp.]